MKFCPRLLIFEPLDCTLGIFRGYDFSVFKYYYFWIDILGFLIQTFEPAPPVCLVMECPPPEFPSVFEVACITQNMNAGKQFFSSSNKFAYEKLKWKFFQRINRALNCKIVNCSVANELSSGKS